MNRISALFSLTLTLAVLTLCGCTKFEVAGKMPQSGLALTFDDYYVDDWFKMLPLLDSFHAKATFYVSNYSKLSSSQRQKLKTIQQHGNEIAFHTTNHYNMNQYLSSSTMEKLMFNEITKGLEKMNADGFYPTTFAYPYGQHTLALDNELLKRFKSVRALNGTNNFAKSMAATSNNQLLYGLGIDESSKRDFDLLLRLLNNCEKNSSCLVLVAHHVGRPDLTMQLPTDKLRSLLQRAVNSKLRFYTISEISN